MDEPQKITVEEVKDHLLAQMKVSQPDHVRSYAEAYEALCRSEDLARRPERRVGGQPGPSTQTRTVGGPGTGGHTD